MGISGIPAIPMIITCLLQGILCDTGIPRTFYGGKICSVPVQYMKTTSSEQASNKDLPVPEMHFLVHF